MHIGIVNGCGFGIKPADEKALCKRITSVSSFQCPWPVCRCTDRGADAVIEELAKGTLPALYRAAFASVLKEISGVNSCELTPEVVVCPVQEKGNQGDLLRTTRSRGDHFNSALLPDCAPPSSPVRPQLRNGRFSFYPVSKEQRFNSVSPSVPVSEDGWKRPQRRIGSSKSVSSVGFCRSKIYES